MSLFWVAFIFYLILLPATQAWLWISSQDVVHKTRRNALVIALRLAAALAILVLAVAPFGAGAALVFTLLMLLPIVTIWFLWTAVPHYVVLQWVLGWPDFDWDHRERRFLFPDRDATGLSSDGPEDSRIPTTPIETGYQDLVGKTGTTTQRLNPSGKVRIEGKTYPARSEVEFIESNTEVEVIRDESFGLIVRPNTSDIPNP